MPDTPDDRTHALDPPPDGTTSAFSQVGTGDTRPHAIDSTDTTKRLEPGVLPEVPGYEVEAELGRGGMGVVYKARQHALGRTVALKMVLAGAHAKAEDLIRFLAEAETAAHLQHQGIIQIFESGRVGEFPFFAMEYVAGGSLADRLRLGPLPPADAARMALQLAEAVAAAHAAGVIHRDLKPSNILLTADGIPKITDFGLARRLDCGNGLTRTGLILGTPSYMPPEQARGDLHEVGPAGDIYSLGAILYEMLTGRPPFRSENPVTTLSLVLHSSPERPRSLNAAVPRDMETIALKCLEKEPAKRYTSAEALATDLRLFLEGWPIQARRASAVEKLRRWAKRNPAVASLVAAVFLSLVIGTAVSTVLAIQSASHAERADGDARELAKKVDEVEAANTVAERRATEANDARRALARTLVDSYVTLGLSAGDQEKPALAALWFARAVEAGDDGNSEVLNRIRVRNWSGETFTPVRAVTAAGDLTHLRFHPAGHHLLGWDRPGRYQLWDLDREAPWSLPVGFEQPTAAGWSPDGKLLALGTRQGKAGVFRFPSGEAVQTWDRGGGVLAVAFDRSGNRVALGGAAVRVWGLNEKRFLSPDLKHPGPIYSVEFTPNGQALATAAVDGKARVFDLTRDSGQAIVTTQHYPSPYPPGFTQVPPLLVNDGKTLVVITGSATLTGIDTSTGETRFTGRSDHPLAYFLALEAAPDGKTFRTCGSSELLLWSADGKRIGPALQHRNTVGTSDLTPDGATLITGCTDRTVRLWDVDKGTPKRLVLPHTASVGAVASSADGSRIATAQADGLIRVWEMPRPIPIWFHGLTRPATGRPAELMRAAELAAGQRIDANSGLVNLTADEWMERWQEHRKEHPLPKP